MKQKDYLWNLGLKDRAVLDNLGKWQASALIDQLKAQHSSSALGLVFLLLLLFGGFVALAALAK